MRRKIFALAAVLALVACSVAYAATAQDKVSGKITASANGSSKKPAVTGMKQTLSISSADTSSHKYADPAVKIVSKVGDLKVENQASYPTCSTKTINSSSKFNGACKSGSLIASGTVKAELWKGSTAEPCTVPLDVYNAGKNKVTFFLALGTEGDSKCVNLTDASAGVPAWAATFKESGKTLVLTIPIPASASTNAANLGLYSAIESQTLNWKKLDKNKKPVIVSTGCTKNKRSYSYTVTSSNGSQKSTTTEKGATSC